MKEDRARVFRLDLLMRDRGYPLEQNRNETSVEIAHAAFAQKARETGDQPGCVAPLRNHPDARGFQRRQEHVRKESSVDARALRAPKSDGDRRDKICVKK